MPVRLAEVGTTALDPSVTTIGVPLAVVVVPVVVVPVVVVPAVVVPVVVVPVVVVDAVLAVVEEVTGQPMPRRFVQVLAVVLDAPG